jgi:hypothetical protein
MKRAVSVSIGSSKRDKAVEVTLLGEKIRIERIGTDGDMEKAAQLLKELDGTVDAFGLGGADLGVLVDGKFYPLHSVKAIVRFVEKTPLVDGEGLKNTLEKQAVGFLHAKTGDYVKERKTLITSGVDRWGMTRSFLDAGYDCVFGDLMFALGIPIPIRSEASLKLLARIMMPIAGRLPFEWIYPTGDKQDERTPKYVNHYEWANVIAGDFHFVKAYMPEKLPGKVIITNTTTPEDVAMLKEAGLKYLITTTPVLDGRSFGTNMMEAALVALAGKGRKLSHAELDEMLVRLQFEPQIQELN